MGKTGNKQWRSRERWDKKVAQEMELETQEIASEHSGDPDIDIEREEGEEVDYMRSLEEKEQLVGSDEEEEDEGEDDESYSPFPEPRFTTGSNSEAIFFQIGGVARAYFELKIDPNVPDKTVFENLQEAFAQTMRSSSTLKPVEKKSRLGCILLIACSRARNRPTDPFLRTVNAVYLIEANHYLSTLALPLPICGALKLPEVQIVNREASTPNQSPSSRVIGIKGRSKAEVPKAAKLQAEINHLKAEVERLKIENSQLKEDKVSIEKREKERYEGELRICTEQLTKEWQGKIGAFKEQLVRVEQIQEGIDSEFTGFEPRESESIKILEGKLERAPLKIILPLSPTPLLSSLSLSANRRMQNSKSNEIQTESVVSVKRDQVKFSEAGSARLDQNEIRAKPEAKLSSRIAMSINNKKDFVIASLSQKVKELNQQLKEQNDYIVNLLAVISSSSSRKPVSKK
ncbi:hypothetical protein JCM5350_007555 [Sporobolomyces pararoseus]